MTTKAQLSGKSGTFLTCLDHPWVRYSATPGDYFWADDNDTFPCDECGEPCVEATASEVIRLVES